MYNHPTRLGRSSELIAIILVVVFLLGLCFTVSMGLREFDDATLRIMTTLNEERVNEVRNNKAITPSVQVRAAATLRDYPITMIALTCLFLLYSWWSRRAGYRFQSVLCALFILLGISTSTRVFFEGFYGVTGEAGFILIGCLIMPVTFFLTLRSRLQLPKKLFITLSVLIIAMMVLNAISIVAGDNRNGAFNWFSLGGFAIQPSEFIKAGLILLASCSYITTHRKLWYCTLSILCCGIVALSGDIGAVVVLGVLFVIMAQLLFDEEWLSILIILLGVTAFLLIIMLSKNEIIGRTAYRRMRDWGDAMTNKEYFQQKNFITATVMGGWMGLGVENSKEFFRIFAGGTDGVLAAVQAIYGLPMILLTFTCYIVIILQCGYNRGNSPACHYLLTQIAAFFTIQILLNYGGALDVLPFTGIVAPLMSQGGSSTLTTMALMGVMLACMAYKSEIPTGKEYDAR